VTYFLESQRYYELKAGVQRILKNVNATVFFSLLYTIHCVNLALAAVPNKPLLLLSLLLYYY